MQAQNSRLRVGHISYKYHITIYYHGLSNLWQGVHRTWKTWKIECAFSSLGKVRENENFTKIQGKLREFHFRKIPGFPDYFTTKMAFWKDLQSFAKKNLQKFPKLSKSFQVRPTRNVYPNDARCLYNDLIPTVDHVQRKKVLILV